jgi:uncharacterized protein YdaT
MLWSEQNYPDEFNSLSTVQRQQAIDIANELVERENMDQKQAIAVAIAKAKDKTGGKFT